MTVSRTTVSASSSSTTDVTNRRYLVFVRSDGQEWTLHGEAEGGLSVAVNLANLIVAKGKASRAQVFEVSGRNGVPQFVYRYGAKSDSLLVAHRE